MLKNGPNLGLLVNGNYGESIYTELLRFFRGVDLLIQPHVKNSSTSTPPVTPVDGDAYVIPVGAIGEWSGKDHQIARWTDQTPVPQWEYFQPRKGWIVHDDEQNTHLKFDGFAWWLLLG